MRLSLARLYPAVSLWQRLLLLPLLLAPALAQAGWNGAPEPVHGFASWIYTPATTMPGGKHALLIVLHGCLQDHSHLKQYGNFEPSAERAGMVVVLPSVGSHPWQGNADAKCWDYDGALDHQHHIAGMQALARQLLARSALNIDPSHVYIAGLSAGGALALAAACRGADLFAGVAAVAGPSVGSLQDFALNDQLAIPWSNVAQAVNSCRSLAGSKAQALATQLAAIAYGDMDLDGSEARNYFFLLGREQWIADAGQLALISVRWSHDNASALQVLYDTGGLGPAEPVQDGAAFQRLAIHEGLPRLSLLQVRQVGHAWPAGGGPVPPGSEGIFIARRGLDFSGYLVSWMLANNLRTRPAAMAHCPGARAKQLHNGRLPAC
jgi:poly(3-hydroxybutyrate) depolymerase